MPEHLTPPPDQHFIPHYSSTKPRTSAPIVDGSPTLHCPREILGEPANSVSHHESDGSHWRVGTPQ